MVIHGQDQRIAESNNSDLAQVFTLPEVTGATKKKSAPVDSINDLYDEDIATDYKSPNADKVHAKQEKKLNSVIEESEEYNVTPSRPAITDAVNSKNVTPTAAPHHRTSTVDSTTKQQQAEGKNTTGSSLPPLVRGLSSAAVQGLQSVQQSPAKAGGVDTSIGSANRLPPLKSAPRSKRTLKDRRDSVESNVFMQKGQEVVHSFHEDELSRSILSGGSKVGGKRESLFSGSKDADPVVDWKEAINQKDAQHANHGKFRRKAASGEVEDFLMKQDGPTVDNTTVNNDQAQLDAVSEVDSQVGATPFNQITNADLASFGNSVKVIKTPRDGAAEQ